MSRPMFDDAIKELEKLADTKIVIKADGVYPNQKPVQKVSNYQDLGTSRIAASFYTMRAENANGHWKDVVFNAAIAHLEGSSTALKRAGDRIARDIMQKIDRIDTGRLKRSMKAFIED